LDHSPQHRVVRGSAGRLLLRVAGRDGPGRHDFRPESWRGALGPSLRVRQGLPRQLLLCVAH
jgi:hypothetical protein